MARVEHKQSSFISATEHDPATRELVVHMKSGRSYSHPGVSAEKVAAFRASPSLGQFYNSVIKREFPGSPR